MALVLGSREADYDWLENIDSPIICVSSKEASISNVIIFLLLLNLKAAWELCSSFLISISHSSASFFGNHAPTLLAGAIRKPIH